MIAIFPDQISNVQCPGQLEGKAHTLFVSISLLRIIKVKPIKFATIIVIVEWPFSWCTNREL